MAGKYQYTGTGVQTFYEQPASANPGGNLDWYQPWNQVMFVNVDSAITITINSYPILPGAFHSVSLRVGQYNTSPITINYNGAGTGSLWVIYSVETINIRQ